MNSLLKRALGIIYVVEDQTNIEVRGVKVATLAQDIIKLWSSKKVERYMFDNFDSKFISFKKFYAPDFHYICMQVFNWKDAKTSKSAIKTALKELEENTWLKNINTEFPDILVKRDAAKLFKKSPMPHQLNFFEAFNHRLPRYGLNGYLLAAGPGSGKDQVLTAKIKVPGGWSTMGAMEVGTVVTAWDGTPSKVMGVFPQGEVPVYKVTFADGRSTECGEQHLWRICDGNRRPHLQWSVVNTIEMMQLISLNDARIHVQLCRAEDGPQVNFSIHPYLMGVILGDGGISNNSITITKGDQQLFDIIEPLLPDGVKLSRRDEITQSLVRINLKESNPLTKALKDFGLMGKTSPYKWIPPEYLHGSKEQRLNLLQGLLDTDGTVGLNGSITFCSTSIRLAWGVQYLVRSLGGIAKISNKQTYYTYNGEYKKGRPSFTVNIRYKEQSELFQLDRKKERTNDYNQYAESLRLKVVSVECAGMAETQCISIDHPDQLYVTDDFVVTHNTYMSLVLAEMLNASLVVMVVPKNAVYRVWLGHLRDEYVKPQEGWVVADGKPYKGERFIIAHFEALDKAKQVATSHGGLVVVILDESHNINAEESLRTQTFIQMCQNIRHNMYSGHQALLSKPLVVNRFHY